MKLMPIMNNFKRKINSSTRTLLYITTNIKYIPIYIYT